MSATNPGACHHQTPIACSHKLSSLSAVSSLQISEEDAGIEPLPSSEESGQKLTEYILIDLSLILLIDVSYM